MNVTFIDPRPGATVNTDAVTVYGTSAGAELATVTLNDRPAVLLGANTFVATVKLHEGRNTLTAVVTGVDGQRATAALQLERKLISGAPPYDGRAEGGCQSAPGLQLGLLALWAIRRLLARRRA